ncbi:hypothetical protein JL722_5136 [Aureococcus anophagefferens]|nr:hypothetical protein JL722_5136 [Aureococcus anophagefferens]
MGLISVAYAAVSSDMVAIPLSAGFGRVALHGDRESRPRLWAEAALIAAVAYHNGLAVLGGNGAGPWRDFGATVALQCLCLLLARGARPAVAAAAAGGVGAPRCAGAGASGCGLVRRGRRAARRGPEARRRRRPGRGRRRRRGRVARDPLGCAALFPVPELADAYAVLESLMVGAGGAEKLRTHTVVLAFVSCHVQLGVGRLGVEYLRLSQKRKNALLGVGGDGPATARPHGRRVAAFVAFVALPYMVQRTSMEAVDGLLFRRYSFALTRSLRLDGVLGTDELPSALHALAGSDLTLERHAGNLETSASRCYQLVSRKVFSLPKLLLLPSIVAQHPVAFAAALPGFLAVDGLKARFLAALTSAIEEKRRESAKLASTRSKVEAHDVAEALRIEDAEATAFTRSRWAFHNAAVEAAQAEASALETVRRYFRWLYWSDFLTPLIEVALAGLLEHDLIETSDVWLMARALEDALDTLLTRSRAEAELGSSRRTSGGCAARWRPRRALNADGAARKLAGDVLAVSGPNGAGKSSLFGLLQACVRGVDAPPGLDLAAGGSIVVPRSVVHVSQRTYGPLHARPVDWLATRAARRLRERDAGHRRRALYGFGLLCFDLQRLDLARDHDDFAGGLSGGQKVKLELVRQLFLPAALGAPCPGLLLLDEIFSPLDPASKAAVRSRLKRACPDAITLAIYHHDAGACVPPADFFTDVLHFGKQPDDTMAVARVRTC